MTQNYNKKKEIAIFNFKNRVAVKKKAVTKMLLLS